MQAKASGNKKQKEVAGEVIRHIKLEIVGLGIKEAVIHQLIAQHFRPAAAKESSGLQVQSAEASPAGAPLYLDQVARTLSRSPRRYIQMKCMCSGVSLYRSPKTQQKSTGMYSLKPVYRRPI